MRIIPHSDIAVCGVHCAAGIVATVPDSEGAMLVKTNVAVMAPVEITPREIEEATAERDVEKAVSKSRETA